MTSGRQRANGARSSRSQVLTTPGTVPKAGPKLSRLVPEALSDLIHPGCRIGASPSLLRRKEDHTLTEYFPLIEELQDRLTDVLRAHGEFCTAAAPWLNGSVQLPLIELEFLGQRMRALESSLQVALREARWMHKDIKAQYAQQETA